MSFIILLRKRNSKSEQCPSGLSFPTRRPRNISNQFGHFVTAPRMPVSHGALSAKFCGRTLHTSCCLILTTNWWGESSAPILQMGQTEPYVSCLRGFLRLINPGGRSAGMKTQIGLSQTCTCLGTRLWSTTPGPPLALYLSELPELWVTGSQSKAAQAHQGKNWLT